MDAVVLQRGYVPPTIQNEGIVKRYTWADGTYQGTPTVTTTHIVHTFTYTALHSDNRLIFKFPLYILDGGGTGAARLYVYLFKDGVQVTIKDSGADGQYRANGVAGTFVFETTAGDTSEHVWTFRINPYSGSPNYISNKLLANELFEMGANLTE